MDNKNDCFVHPSSYVDEVQRCGTANQNSGIFALLFSSGAVIGESCSLGQNVNIANNVKVGNRRCDAEQRVGFTKAWSWRTMYSAALPCVCQRRQLRIGRISRTTRVYAGGPD
ncbi:MAG: hypothetical protein ACLUHA_11530 [Bacteroides stercoris]